MSRRSPASHTLRPPALRGPYGLSLPALSARRYRGAARHASHSQPDLSAAHRAHLADRLRLHAGEYLPALALFIVAAVSDGLDGYLAKHFSWTSNLGSFLDPLADKLLLVTVFVETAWLGLVPWWLTAAVVARDVMIGLGALVFRLWFGPLHGRPTLISKINTAAQLLYVMLVLLAPPQGCRRARFWTPARCSRWRPR